MAEIVARGPIACGICVTEEFDAYTEGIFHDKTGVKVLTCVNITLNLRHVYSLASTVLYIKFIRKIFFSSRIHRIDENAKENAWLIKKF